MSFIYSQSSGLNNAAIGKLTTPIRMVIERESDLQTSKKGVREWLFNIEKSRRFAETIVGQTEFDTFTANEEGAGSENNSVEETYKKIIEHIQFSTEFSITAKMMADANYGVAADAKLRAQNFVRAYYKTMHKACSAALANGTSTTATFARATLNLTAPDGLALFDDGHTWGGTRKSGTQSNYFYGSIFGSVSEFEIALGQLASKIRNMKDENGEVLGYTADTIILPGNQPAAEIIAKKVVGSDGTLGSGNNDINIQYGGWNIIVLPDWQAADARCMIMSSEANKTLRGNMFFEREPLTVTDWVDNHTGNYIWNGRCRFGLGFGSYKHIALAVDTATTVSGATALT